MRAWCWSRWWITAVLMIATVVPMSRAQEAEPAVAEGPAWRVASGEAGVWVVRRDGETVTLSLAELAEGETALRRVVRLGEMPRLMVASEDGPLLIFQARGSAGERIFPVRRARFEDRAGIAVVGSLEATTPLRTGDEIVSGCSAGGRVYLLTSSPDNDRGASLRTLSGGRWARVGLPVELADASLDPSGLRLLEVGGALGVLVDGPVEGVSVLWTLGAVDFDALDDSEELPAEWSDLEVPLDLRGREARASGLGDEAIVVAGGGEGATGEVECLLLRRQGPIRFALLEDRQMPRAVATHGRMLWLLWDGEGDTVDAVVLGPDGSVEAAGQMSDASARRGEDGVLFLLLVAWSVVISVLVLMMPQNRKIRIVVPPEGYVLAEPSRRLLAALVDLLPGMVVVSLLWGKPLIWWLSPLSEIIASDGSMPLFTLAWLTFALLSIGDGVFGRTPGKLLTGCSTMREDGGKPGLRRGAARSFLKVFCPPLVVVLVLMPFAPAPWSFGTVVVRKSRPEPDEE